MALDIFNNTVPGMSTLDTLLDPNDAKSTFRQKILTINENFRQVTPNDIYTIAAESLVPQAKTKIKALIKKGKLIDCGWICMVHPCINTANFYGYLMHTASLEQFVRYTLSVLAASRVTHRIASVNNPVLRGQMLQDYVIGITSYKLPHRSVKFSLGNKSWDTILHYPIDNFYLNSDGKLVKPTKSKTFYTANYKMSKGSKKDKNTRINCRNCAQSVLKSKIREHNKICTKAN